VTVSYLLPCHSLPHATTILFHRSQIHSRRKSLQRSGFLIRRLYQHRYKHPSIFTKYPGVMGKFNYPSVKFTLRLPPLPPIHACKFYFVGHHLLQALYTNVSCTPPSKVVERSDFTLPPPSLTKLHWQLLPLSLALPCLHIQLLNATSSASRRNYPSSLYFSFQGDRYPKEVVLYRTL